MLFVLSLAAAFISISTMQASANIVVNPSGPGAGIVESDPKGAGGGIECSNVGSGTAGPKCSESFPTFTPSSEPNPVKLTATPAAGFVFEGWTADDPLGFFVEPHSCNASSESSCLVFDPQEVAEIFNVPPDTHITATFGCAAPIPSPQAVTGDASAGGDFSLHILHGTVDPEGCGLEESFFEYGLSTNYGSTTQTKPDAAGIGKGSDPAPVSAETEPLEPNTTYHYRLVAVGPGGTSYGEDRSFITGPVSPGACPNEARRLEQGIKALHLPACMALEMVSPPQKAGAPAKLPNVSADGSRVSFISEAALGEHPGGVFNEVTYVASRGGSGWTSESSVPDRGFAQQWNLLSEFHPSFTPDFSRWLGIGATAQQLQQGIGQAYEAGVGGIFTPLSTPLVPLVHAEGTPQEIIIRGDFQGASFDHSHLYFQPGLSATYLPGDPGHEAESGNVYLARRDSAGQFALELPQRDRAGKLWGGNCGARLGGFAALQVVPAAENGERTQGAVSADGSRTYLSARAAQPESGSCDTANKLRILVRLETPSGPQILPLFTSECNRPAPEECSSVDGDDLFQGASLNQTKVYFTTNRQLANSDRDGSSEECDTEVAVAGCDLYLDDLSRPAGERLVQVSAGEELGPGLHEAGREADVFNGITAISADGSHVYFVAEGVLTNDPNPAGEIAQGGKPNLYMWDEESEKTAFLGTLNPGDGTTSSSFSGLTVSGLWGGPGTWRNDAYPVPVLSPAEQDGDRGEEGGDGHILIFESRAELAPNDSDGAHLDVYSYDADAETLQCLSCAPGSSASDPDEAPVDVDSRGEVFPPGTDFAESHRWVSEDGEEVGFMTPEGLLPGDVNGEKDGYLWRQGSLFRLPGRPFGGERAGVAQEGPFLSHDGSTVAFVTGTPLLPQDGDKTGDVYVAREEGGFPNPSPPHACEPGSDCQPAQTPPAVPHTASEAAGPGNTPQGSHCPKSKVRRHGRCVPRRTRKHRVKKPRPARQAKTDRMAEK